MRDAKWGPQTKANGYADIVLSSMRRPRDAYYPPSLPSELHPCSQLNSHSIKEHYNMILLHFMHVQHMKARSKFKIIFSVFAKVAVLSPAKLDML